MEEHMKENGKMVNSMDKVNILVKMEVLRQVFGKMEKEQNGQNDSISILIFVYCHIINYNLKLKIYLKILTYFQICNKNIY